MAKGVGVKSDSFSMRWPLPAERRLYALEHPQAAGTRPDDVTEEFSAGVSAAGVTLSTVLYVTRDERRFGRPTWVWVAVAAALSESGGASVVYRRKPTASWDGADEREGGRALTRLLDGIGEGDPVVERGEDYYLALRPLREDEIVRIPGDRRARVAGGSAVDAERSPR